MVLRLEASGNLVVEEGRRRIKNDLKCHAAHREEVLELSLQQGKDISAAASIDIIQAARHLNGSDQSISKRCSLGCFTLLRGIACADQPSVPQTSSKQLHIVLEPPLDYHGPVSSNTAP